MSDQREFLAQWSQSQGNLRRFLEERVMPPLDDDAQRTAGRAAEPAGRQKISPPDPEVPQDTEAAAFFDVDNTLIQGSSLILLAQGLFKKRFITLSELAPALRKQIRYRISGSENADDIAEGREQALAIVKGKSVEELKQACREIVDNRMLQKSYADTIELASMHLAAGQQVWLVSATPVQIGQALAETLGFTGALGTVAEEEDGKFTGRLVGDILHGPGKKHAVAALAALQQLDLSKCTAYSDSINDLPMLEMVGSPVAINPDRALRKHAKAQGWAVRDYRSVRRVVRAGVVPAVLAGAGLWWWRRRR